MSQDYKIPISISGHEQAAKGLGDVAGAASKSANAMAHSSREMREFAQASRVAIHGGESLARVMEGNATSIYGVARAAQHLGTILKTNPELAWLAGLAAAAVAVGAVWKKVTDSAEEAQKKLGTVFDGIRTSFSGLRETFSDLKFEFQIRNAGPQQLAETRATLESQAAQIKSDMKSGSDRVPRLNAIIEQEKQKILWHVAPALEDMLYSNSPKARAERELAQIGQSAPGQAKRLKEIEDKINKIKPEQRGWAIDEHGQKMGELNMAYGDAQTAMSPIEKAQAERRRMQAHIGNLNAQKNAITGDKLFMDDPNKRAAFEKIKEQIVEASTQASMKDQEITGMQFGLGNEAVERDISRRRQQTGIRAARIGGGTLGASFAADMANADAHREVELRKQQLDVAGAYNGPGDKAKIVAEAEGKLNDALKNELETREKIKEATKATAEEMFRMAETGKQVVANIISYYQERITGEKNLIAIDVQRETEENKTGRLFGDKQGSKLSPEQRRRNRLGINRGQSETLDADLRGAMERELDPMTGDPRTWGILNQERGELSGLRDRMFDRNGKFRGTADAHRAQDRMHEIEQDVKRVNTVDDMASSMAKTADNTFRILKEFQVSK